MAGEPPQAVFPGLFGPRGRWPLPGAATVREPITPENVEARTRAALIRAGHAVPD